MFMLRVVNFLKFLSILLFLGVLLLVYAYLPVMVNLSPGHGDLELRKEVFFYCSVGFFVAVNICLLFVQQRTEPAIPELSAKAWARGAAFAVNICVALLIGFIGALNNTNHLDLAGFAYLNYLGIFVVLGWAAGLVYFLCKKS